MLVECQKCGAPLDVKTSVRFVKCTYCGTSTRLQSTRTLAMQTPAGWKPPPVWTPPPATQLPQVAMAYRKQSARFVGCYVFFFVIIGLVSAVVPFVASNAIQIPFFNKVARWDKASTLTCAVNEELVLEDLTARVAFGPVVEAGPNCRLTIRRSHLEGTTIVHGGVNTSVVVEDSQLIASDQAITGNANLAVSIRGQSTIDSGSHAVFAQSGAEVEIDGPSTLSCRGDAIEGSTNLAVHVRGGRIVAGGTAIVGNINPEIRLVDATIQGAQAWDLGVNARVDITSSSITGARVQGRNANVVER